MSGKLKELQEKRMSLAAQIRELGNAESKDAAWQGNWKKANDDYDANFTLLEQERKRCPASRSIIASGSA